MLPLVMNIGVYAPLFYLAPRLSRRNEMLMGEKKVLRRKNNGGRSGDAEWENNCFQSRRQNVTLIETAGDLSQLCTNGVLSLHLCGWVWTQFYKSSHQMVWSSRREATWLLRMLGGHALDYGRDLICQGLLMKKIFIGNSYEKQLDANAASRAEECDTDKEPGAQVLKTWWFFVGIVSVRSF